MPTITFSQNALRSYLSTQPSEEELKEAITMIGTDIESFGKEISVEIFPNRPDLLSVAGLARALNSFLTGEPGKKYSAQQGTFSLTVEEAVKSVRPHIACAVAQGLTLTNERIEELIMLQEKLHITFGRGRKKVAIGIYPQEHIIWPLTYTAKKPSEITFTPLESSRAMNGSEILTQHETGKKYASLLEGASRYPLIIDSSGKVLSMPPVINSEEAGRVTQTTTDVFVECTGPAIQPLQEALNMICCALADMGATIYTVDITDGKWQHTTPQLNSTRMPLDIPTIAHKASIPEDQVIPSIRKMGHQITDNTIETGCYRTDFLHSQDIVEEAAIGYGYENIEAIIPNAYTIGQLNSTTQILETISTVLSGKEYQEVMSYLLTREGVALQNPLTQEMKALRTNIIDGLFEVLARNISNEYPQYLFESGTIFSEDKESTTGVKEQLQIAAVRCTEPSTLSHGQELLATLAHALKWNISYEATNDERFIQGRCARITGDVTGIIGEVHPRILAERNILKPAVGWYITL